MKNVKWLNINSQNGNAIQKATFEFDIQCHLSHFKKCANTFSLHLKYYLL